MHVAFQCSLLARKCVQELDAVDSGTQMARWVCWHPAQQKAVDTLQCKLILQCTGVACRYLSMVGIIP